jgi:hypothetical protein
VTHPIEKEGFISLWFLPEQWAGIWAGLMFLNASPEEAPDEAKEIEITMIRPIEKALIDTGHEHLLDEMRADFGIGHFAANKTPTESFRGWRTAPVSARGQRRAPRQRRD